nr:MAG TPA: hypothetical protein [Caudoviricetes sp.]
MLHQATPSPPSTILYLILYTHPNHYKLPISYKANN